MIMKIKLFIIIFFAAIFSSCEDTFLSETPYNKVTQGNYYTTVDGIKGGVNGLYARLRYIYFTESTMNILENGTDLNIWPNMSGRPPVDPTTNYVRDFWNTCYININQCNEVIEALEENELPGLTVQLRERYLGEAKFIRAHYFDHLVKQFGDVPMSLKPSRGIVTTATRTPASEVWEQIITDLTYAAAKCPEKYADQSQDYGRVTKYAAMHNLAKVLLTAKRDDMTSVAKAQAYADSIINSGNYSLQSTWSLWDINNMRNSEVIFPVCYSRDVILNGIGNRSHLFFVSGYSEVHPGVKRVLEYGRGWIRTKPTRYAYELFLTPGVDTHNNHRLADKRGKDWFISDWRITQPTFSQTLFNPVTKQNETVSRVKGDLAMIAPYWYNDVIDAEYVKRAWPIWIWLPDHMKDVVGDDIQSESNPDATWPSNTKISYIMMYPYLRKHLDPLRPDLNYTNGSRDVFVYRLAETYLIAGEAAYLLGNHDAAADYINVVRKRAERTDGNFVGKLRITADDITDDFILDERGRELIGELHRWYDLKRFGKMTERMNGSKIYYQTPAYEFQKYMELRPIPRDQMLNMTNADEFPQNPGYSN
jgi:starch-binding outer membrane protein, SusD/RagB family